MRGVEGRVANACHQLNGKSGQDQPGWRDPADEPFGGERAEDDAGNDGQNITAYSVGTRSNSCAAKVGAEAA